MKKWFNAALEIAYRALWFPLLVFIAHFIAANLLPFNAYYRYLWLDIPMHFMGGIAIAYFIAKGTAILNNRGLIELEDPLVLIGLIIGLTSTAAIIWEIAEWAGDYFLGTTAQVSLDDTMLDMIIGLGGATVYIVLFELRKIMGKRTNSTDTEMQY